MPIQMLAMITEASAQCGEVSQLTWADAEGLAARS